jgi:hypothetical protein
LKFTKNVKRQIASLLPSILFLPMWLGCSSPSLFVSHQNDIGIVADKNSISVRAKPLLQDTVTLDRIYITRTLYGLKEHPQHIVYEEVRLQVPNQFKYDMPRTLGILFETPKYRMIERVGNLSFFSITLKDGRTILLIAQNINKQALKLIYGLDARQMNAALEHVNSKTRIDAQTAYTLLPADTSAFLIRWNAKMTMLDGLLKRMGGRPMGGG